MSFFLVGGGVDDGLGEVYDEFIAEARIHTGHQGGKDAAPGRIAVVVAGPAETSGDQIAVLSQIVASRWPEAEVSPIYLTGPGTSPAAPTQVSGTAPGADVSDTAPTWSEDPDFALPGGLDALDGIIVGGGRVASYIAGLGPAAELLSRLVRGGAPWLGFSAGAMVTAVAAVQGGRRLDGRLIAPQAAADGVEDLTIVEGLGLVSVTTYARNDVLSADGLLISAVEAGLLRSAVAIDEGTCLKVQQGSGRVTVMGGGLVRWFTKDPAGVVVRSERNPRQPSAPTPAPPRFSGLAQVAAATRAAHRKESEQTGRAAEKKDTPEPAPDAFEQEAPTTQKAPAKPAAERGVAPGTMPAAEEPEPEPAGGHEQSPAASPEPEEQAPGRAGADEEKPAKRTTTRRRTAARTSGKTAAKTSTRTSAKQPATRTRKTRTKAPTGTDPAGEADSTPADPAQAES